MVPHQRTEYTAASIVAYLTVDHDQFASYGVEEPGVELLEALVDFEIASLFTSSLRLRTACDLDIANVVGPPLPELAAATERVQTAIRACDGLLGPVTNVVWQGRV